MPSKPSTENTEPVPTDVLTSIDVLLAYLGDEEKHWRENGRPAKHIYTDIKKVTKWRQRCR